MHFQKKIASLKALNRFQGSQLNLFILSVLSQCIVKMQNVYPWFCIKGPELETYPELPISKEFRSMKVFQCCMGDVMDATQYTMLTMNDILILKGIIGS